MARKKTIRVKKIKVEDGAEQIPVRIIKHLSVREAVVKLYSEMTPSEARQAYRRLKRVWRAERIQRIYEKLAGKQEDKLTNLLKGE